MPAQGKWIKTLLLLAGLGVAAALAGNVRAAPAQPSYGVQAAQVAYLPASPFHITDMRDDPAGEPVLYEDKSDFETRTVTIYQPTEGGAPLQERPVVFFVHGGGWTDGYAAWYGETLTPALTTEFGWVVVNVDYRLTSAKVYLADENCSDRTICNEILATKAAWHPDNIADVAEAFAWTVSHISEYGGDRRNIFLFGHSAGGHLVSLLATHSDYAHLRPHMRGVISLSGAYRLKSLDPVFALSINQTFHGGFVGNSAELDEASPYTYVAPGEPLPPFLVLQAESDMPSLPEQADAFVSLLQANGFAVEATTLAGEDHVSEMEHVADSSAAVTQQAAAFIQGRLSQTIYLPWIAR
ncbi:MAG: alpha/beta hydrolase [Chloroflexi bacterium]|nr:alpha/beta hydrolase [Chloroflexota bacterium]